MRRLANKKATFFVVVLLTAFLTYVAFAGLQIGDFHLKSAAEMRFGIDIKGGIDAAFVPKDLDHQPTEAELESAREVLETRLDQRNILDREVTIDKENSCIFVRFPWKADETDFDPDKAIAELGSMARLTFRDPDGNVVLEGKHVEKAAVTAEQQYGTLPVVQLTLKPEGQQLFAEATGRLVGQQISIFLDETMISSPTVETMIDSETCIINGLRSLDEARTLSNQINSGALPFALITQHYNTISPSLGSNALSIMIYAGLTAFILICLALIAYYRASGVIAVISLLLQIVGQILMLTWPQLTVTLPGIAGIILSIGMGVDANVISAERIREELRGGKSVSSAVTSGFKNSFSSIFDGNITVLIAAFVMMYFGSGAILSFAYTLLFGIIMNFVAGVTATRLMTISLTRFDWMKNPHLFAGKRYLEKKEVKVHSFFSKRKIYFAISILIVIAGIVTTLFNGVQLDIQFKGGTLVRYAMSETVELNTDDVANVAEQALPGRIVTSQITTDYTTGEKLLVLSITGEGALGNEELQNVTALLQETYPEQSFESSEINNVSPFFGKKFLQRAYLAVALSAILIMLYVWYSFRKIHGLSAAITALLSLLHDLIVVFFAFIAFRIPIGESFVAVALTILGYSINDTIVIYDRIRENTRNNPKMPVDEVVDKSVSQSFTRSLNTNMAVFFSVAIMCAFSISSGLESVTSFALPMAIGSISGAYSTICIAGPLWAMWQKRKNTKKEAAKA